MVLLNENLSPAKRALAIIGLAEKGYVTLKITARAKAGHSSIPPAKTALGTLAGAIYRLEQNQMPASLSGPIGQFFDHIGPEMPLVQKVLLANRWVFEGILIGQLEKVGSTNAAIRTTTAPTMIQGGVMENVLPSQAHVLINFRIRPGDKVSDVVAHAKEVIDDPAIEVRIHGKKGINPSPVSSTDSPAFKAIKRSISEVYPGILVAPGLVLGQTDSRHYASISNNNYRFAPMIFSPADLERLHGTDERMSIDNYARMIQYYAQFIKNYTGSQHQAN
jgi:carboxypeptidase PM20D1